MSAPNPGAPGHPSFNGNTLQSAIRWNTPDTLTIAAGATKSFTYRITYPATIASNRSYRNDVDVISYASESDRQTLVQHFPAAPSGVATPSVDTTVTAAQIDVPAAHDDHTLVTPNATVAKSNVTEVDDSTQGASPATIHYGADRRDGDLHGDRHRPGQHDDLQRRAVRHHAGPAPGRLGGLRVSRRPGRGLRDNASGRRVVLDSRARPEGHVADLAERWGHRRQLPDHDHCHADLRRAQQRGHQHRG